MEAAAKHATASKAAIGAAAFVMDVGIILLLIDWSPVGVHPDPPEESKQSNAIR